MQPHPAPIHSECCCKDCVSLHHLFLALSSLRQGPSFCLVFVQPLAQWGPSPGIGCYSNTDKQSAVRVVYIPCLQLQLCDGVACDGKGQSSTALVFISGLSYVPRSSWFQLANNMGEEGILPTSSIFWEGFFNLLPMKHPEWPYMEMAH